MPEIVLPEYLSIDGEPCASRAFQHLDLSPLLAEADRTSNETVPYVDGTIAYPGWLAEVDAAITWLVNGRWDPEGELIDDPQTGLYDNLEHYRSLFRDDTDPDGTKPFEMHVGEFIYSGVLQCKRWAPVRTGPSTMTVVTRLVVPAGRLEEEGS